MPPEYNQPSVQRIPGGSHPRPGIQPCPAGAARLAQELEAGARILVNLSGRGGQDVAQVAEGMTGAAGGPSGMFC